MAKVTFQPTFTVAHTGRSVQLRYKRHWLPLRNADELFARNIVEALRQGFAKGAQPQPAYKDKKDDTLRVRVGRNAVRLERKAHYIPVPTVVAVLSLENAVRAEFAKPVAPRQRKSKLYTRTGDQGKTALFGGGRVGKDHLRVEAYGSVDELNSALGVAASFLRQRRIIAALQSVQNELFNVGSELASESGPRAEKGRMFLDPERKIAELERLIDEYDAKVPPLRTFILPSGSQAGALLHLARGVCRRAERAVVRLSREEDVNPHVLTYLNRLSDLLFVLARYVNKAARRPETQWRKG